jgi:hypothetical protein
MNNNLNFLNSKYYLNGNEEFKEKLFKMGKTSQIRFTKLAKLFSKKFKLNNRFNNKQQSILNNNNEVYVFKGDEQELDKKNKFHENENY